MSYRGWQSWARRFRQEWSTAEEGGSDAAPERTGGVSRRLFWMALFMGLLLAGSVGWGLLLLNREAVRLSHPATGNLVGVGVQSLRQAWVVPSNAEHFPEGATGRKLTLPDEWAINHPRHEGGIWYRFQLDEVAPRGATDESLRAIYIERACSNVEVHLNGEVLYRGGRMTDPYARHCYRSHVVTLPSALLKARGNVLDLKVVGYPLEQVAARQRAGGLASVRVGALADIRELAEDQEFWTSTLAGVLGGILAVMGLFALGLAWIRRLDYLMYFGLVTTGWSLATARFWLTELPAPNAAVEVLIAMMFAPLVGCAVQFVLCYAGARLQPIISEVWMWRVRAWLWVQCALVPLTLVWLGFDRIFLGVSLWYPIFAIEICAGISYFLLAAGKRRRPEFWLMSVIMGVVVAVLGIELSYQFGWIKLWGVHVTHFVMPVLYAAVAIRLMQVYAKALQAAQGAKAKLEQRVKEVTAEMERNFNQIAELRAEQVAEKERKRIASDLHDDLGAKLLTIVHTSNNDRISTLAREALEEMRLSVRGLTGRPMVLSDALADWRAEVVSRLRQAGIECEWRNPNDIIEEPLSSRTYVQTTRILREAVSNVIKHSGASHVIVSAEVHLDLHDFVLVIQDNGKGIELALDDRTDRGHGMTSMKHRAKQLSGQCLVESGPGFGTIIRLTLPLEVATMQHPGSALASHMVDHVRSQ